MISLFRIMEMDWEGKDRKLEDIVNTRGKMDKMDGRIHNRITEWIVRSRFPCFSEIWN